MLRKFFLLCAVTCVYAASADAQQKGNSGGACQSTGQPSPTQKTNKTVIGQAGQPADPDPEPSRDISIYGRIIAQATLDFPAVQVRVETDGGQPVGIEFAKSTGEFAFRTSGFNADQEFYVLVNMEGYKPFRDRVNGGFNFTNGYCGFTTVFLELDGAKTPEKTGGTVVDLKQLRSKVPAKAVDEYEKALKDSEKVNMGSVIEHLQRAVKLAPDFYEAQTALGAQYLKILKFPESETALMRAKDLSPNAAEPVINLGKLYYLRAQEQSDAGKSDEAAAAFRKALAFLEESVRRDPASAPANSYLGAALYKTGSYDEAESKLNRALELDAQETDAGLMLINVYVKQTHYDKALALIKTFLTKNPRTPHRTSLESMQARLEKALAQ
jgi:tetratricopeptide (TPR) repeat protein